MLGGGQQDVTGWARAGSVSIWRCVRMVFKDRPYFRRHKKAVEEKLSDMKRKAVSDMKSAKDEAHWLRKMEEAALRDYKSKDISSSRL